MFFFSSFFTGDLSFWHRDESEENHRKAMRIIADWREPCTVLCGWAPDGRHFFSASTYPRMKVDNQFKVFDREGRILSTGSYAQLLDFQWKPEVSGVYT